MVTKSRRAIGVGILGHYGTRNLGDEAIIAAVIHNINKRFPQVRICGYSIGPADTRKRHGIEAFPVRNIRSRGDGVRAGRRPPAGEGVASGEKSRSGLAVLKGYLKALPLIPTLLRLPGRILRAVGGILAEVPFLMKSYRSLAGVDLLLVAGSGQLEDEWGGAWEFPYTIFKWTLLARLAGARVAFISVGAGPIFERASKVLIRLSLSLSDYSSFRDQASRQWIELISARGECLVIPDLAHSLAVGDPDVVGAPARTPVVGINPMPVYDKRYWHASDTGKYEDYVTKLAAFATDLVRKGYPLFFFSTHPKDELVIEDIVSRMDDAGGKGSGRKIPIMASRSVETLVSTLSNADIVIATRFHGILLAQLVGTPVVGICKDSKQHELMKSMGQSAYALPFDNFDEGDLQCKFQALEANRMREVMMLRSKGEEFRHALDRQYDRVFGFLLEPGNVA